MLFSYANFKVFNRVLTLKNIKFFRGFSISSECWKPNHYEVLGISESCTNKEIKTAYLEKIKLLHPDKNANTPNSTECHNLVISVTEAYGVLSKADSRASYDHQLALERGRFYANSIERDSFDRGLFRDTSIWENRNRWEDKYYEDKPYYGIKGIKRLPNNYVATGVIIFMIIGAIFHYFFAKISTDYALRKLDESSAKAAANYTKARERALMNKNIGFDQVPKNHPPNTAKKS